jgi:lysophospholipase L1-like esterase
VTARPSQPEPFVRGVAYPAAGDVPYPRANPTDTARLPADIWTVAAIPVGVRLEVVGDARAIDIAYRTTTGNLGYRGDSAGISFSVWRGGRKVCEEEAVLGDGLIRLSLGSGAPDKPAVIYLPEGMHPIIQSLTAVKGEIAPAPALPRWIAYGDWTTQGWTASGPAQAWTAIAARKVGLDVVNFGYAGAGRGEIVSAEHIAALEAEAVTIAYGATCWTRIPFSVGMVEEGFRAFLEVVRQGHPTAPVIVTSPIVRPDAEDEPNKLGATMSDIRHAIEQVTRDRILSGDTALSLVAGATVIGEEHLADGIHPGDEGHKRIASAIAKALVTAMRSPADDTSGDSLRANELLLAGHNGTVDRAGAPKAANADLEDDQPEADSAFDEGPVDVDASDGPDASDRSDASDASDGLDASDAAQPAGAEPREEGPAIEADPEVERPTKGSRKPNTVAPTGVRSEDDPDDTQRVDEGDDGLDILDTMDITGSGYGDGIEALEEVDEVCEVDEEQVSDRFNDADDTTLRVDQAELEDDDLVESDRDVAASSSH